MTQIIYTDRSRIQSAQRCRRLRWLNYHEGAAGVGLEAARRSSHLVVGGAVHAGMEVLLREGQVAVDSYTAQWPESSLEEALNYMFAVTSSLHGVVRPPAARQIEDRAVEAALAEFQSTWSEGVELDPEEARQRQLAAGGVEGQPEVINDLTMDLNDRLRASIKRESAGGASEVGAGGVWGGAATSGGESPIIVEFGDLVQGGFDATTSMQAAPPAESITAYQPFDQDQWLKEEMAALVEGMVRTWARRRWRGVLAEFEVLEVEREGEWRLAEWDEPHDLGCHSSACQIDHHRELHFLSRHDALLLERSTGYLYLQSFKTTGAWDRRKELDAQVDMQGLSEAVDVERRFGEAWALIDAQKLGAKLDEVREYRERRIGELVSPRVAEWLRALPDPPTILGVRYEYLLKGSRKENKKAGPGEPRWNQESVLVRAYSQEGITSEDRRWAWTYDWKDEGGKGRRLDYRSWQKAAVWRAMPMADWIDLLDQGKVQEGALGEDGEELDALGAQLVPVVVAYRNSDEMLDLLEQLESQEVQIAKDVEGVRRAEREGGYSAKRSALNRLFIQTRTACSYPGTCEFRSMPTRPGFCFGPPDAEHDPGVLEHYRSRVANHPREAEGLVQIGGGDVNHASD